MASSAHIANNVTAMLECSLCLSTFKLPKCLPCVHTFCLDCLQNYVDKNKFSDKLPCPLCRHVFTIPLQGLSSLPNNFYIQNMIDLERNVRIASENLTAEVRCDLCLDQNNIDRSPAAVKFCPECNENLCQACATCHSKMKATKSHTVVFLGEKTDDPLKPVKSHPRPCDRHRNKLMNLYCLKCDVCMCVSCMLTHHNEHKCEDIEDTFARYLNQFDAKILALLRASMCGHNSFQDLSNAENQVIKASEKNELKIRERCEELRNILDSLEGELLSETRSFRDKVLTEIRSQLDEVELQNLQLECFIQYLKELKEKGSNYDVASTGKELVTRVENLLTSSKKTFMQEAKVIQRTFIPNRESIGVEFGRKLLGEMVTGETTAIILGLDTDSSIASLQKICQISLPRSDTIKVINSTPSTPAHIGVEPAACVVDNVFYAVGIGEASNELWAWSPSRDIWTRCADMLAGRRRHCVTSVGNKIYVLGGLVDSDKKTLDSILCYDIDSKTWSETGQLCFAVMNATCVAYKHQVFVFGRCQVYGSDRNLVQVYDTDTGNLSLLTDSLPGANLLMRAVLWKSMALIFGYENCYIYDCESNVWQERKRFKTDVWHFGLTLDGNTLYIYGGITHNSGVWTYKDEVKSLLVDDFLSDNEEAEWKHHATLPIPACISAYSSTPLLSTIAI